jgi:L-iditol 2-dehydrogenase
MRVAVLTDPGEFEIVERERPEPAADEALVRVREVGICGSDLHYYEHGHIGDRVVEDPHVLGHESAGDVEAVGSDVDSLAPGDRVAIEPGLPCRRCAYCKRGEYHLCPDVTFMGSPPVDGALAEYVAWPADFCYRLPDAVSTREGALCEPLSVGIHAARRGDVASGDSVLVTGGGPIGLCVLEAVRAAGATDVVVSEPVERKRDLASDRGADRVVDPTAESLADAVAAHTDGRGVDVTIEASGARPAIEAVPETVHRGGTVVLVGMPTAETVDLDALGVINGEVDVRGSYRYANTYPTAVSLLADDHVDVSGIVEFDAPLADVESAFERALDPETVKGTIHP